MKLMSENNNATVVNSSKKLLVDQVYDSSTEEGEASEDSGGMETVDRQVQQVQRSHQGDSIAKDDGKTKQTEFRRNEPTRHEEERSQSLSEQEIIDRAVNPVF